jgi:hypothetical protein
MVGSRARQPHAFDWLARAHLALFAQAGAVTDARLLQGLLRHIPHHCEIVAAWAAASLGTLPR